MQRSIVRLITCHIVGCSNDLRLRLAHARLRALHLRLQLWHIQHSQHLALLYLVTNVDVDAANIARDFGMKLDLLVGKKLACDSERVCKRRA